MTDSAAFLPVAMPNLSDLEASFALDAIESTWISSRGKYIAQFEAEFASVCAAEHCLTTSNGTTALHLALLGLGLGAGDEVIVPSLTYIATANAVRYCGAEPTFADVSSATWTLCVDSVESQINEKTRGIVAVHLYGHPCDMDALQELADSHGLWLVEDAAEAHFATYKGQPVGALADIGTFSFFGNKIITSGEGGAVTFNKPELLQTMSMLRGQGMDPQKQWSFPIVGHNFRLTNVAAALLCAQLQRRAEIQDARRTVYSYYRQALAGIRGLSLQPTADWAEVAPWLFAIRIDAREYGMNARTVMASLRAEHIDTRPFFSPVHLEPPYFDPHRQGRLLSTEDIASSGLNLPTHHNVTESVAETVAQHLRSWAKN